MLKLFEAGCLFFWWQVDITELKSRAEQIFSNFVHQNLPPGGFLFLSNINVFSHLIFEWVTWDKEINKCHINYILADILKCPLLQPISPEEGNLTFSIVSLLNRTQSPWNSKQTDSIINQSAERDPAGQPGLSPRTVP